MGTATRDLSQSGGTLSWIRPGVREPASFPTGKNVLAWLEVRGKAVRDREAELGAAADVGTAVLLGSVVQLQLGGSSAPAAERARYTPCEQQVPGVFSQTWEAGI